MIRPYICAPCRWRILQCARAVSPYRQRQWLSYESRRNADTNALNNGLPGTNSTGSTRYSRPWMDAVDSRPDALPHSTSAPTHDRQNTDILRPDDLLRQLKPLDPARLQYTKRQSIESIPIQFIQPYKEFRQLWKNDNRAAWLALQRLIAQASSVSDIQDITRKREGFAVDLFFWQIEAITLWLADLKEISPSVHNKRERRSDVAPSIDQPRPLPTQVLKVYSAALGSVRMFWGRILWVMSSTIFDMSIQRSSAGFRDRMLAAIQELMSVWNICLRLKEQPGLGVLPTDSGSDALESLALAKDAADWSFLPHPEAIASRVREMQADDLHKALHVFIHGHAIKSSPGGTQSAQVYDYASSAMITLELLKTFQDDIHSVSRDLPDYNAYNTFIQSITRSCGRSAVYLIAIADKIKSTQDPVVKSAYTAVIKSLKAMAIANGEISNRSAVDSTEPSALEDSQAELDPPSGRITLASTTSSTSTTELHHGSDIENFDSASSAAENFRIPHDDAHLQKFILNSQKRLGRALETQNITFAEKTYREILNVQEKKPSIKLPLYLYETLLFTFLSLRRPRTAIQIWHKLSEMGYQLTSKTYTVMMRGAQHVRDIEGMQNLWSRMRSDGIKPDAHAWSVVIFGLLRSGRFQDGFKKLHEMSQEWLQAAKMAFQQSKSDIKARSQNQPSSLDLIATYSDDLDGAVRPNLVIMNSAISALAGKDDTLIPKVLEWGHIFGVQPNINTYNVLLNVQLRHGFVDKAMELFRQMGEHSIAANQTTWTVVLAGMFHGGHFKDLSPQEQEKKILTFLRSVSTVSNEDQSEDTRTQAQGVDQKGYALIIDRLLKDHNNASAAQTVLDYMTSQGIRPNAHMFTILMTAYFQQSPPDLEAVEALWNSSQSGDDGYGDALDSVFYDRMIEGYARHHAQIGSSTPMLQFLRRMESEGKKASWRALNAAARCLAERNEWDQLAKLVESVRVRLSESGQYVGMTGLQIEALKTGRRDFVNFIIQTGVLADHGITRSEHLILPRQKSAR